LETPTDKPFEVKIQWGSDISSDKPVKVYRFATQAELNAFFEGVDEASGWLDYDIVEENTEGNPYGTA
jgi:hypothetical protein